MNKSKTTNNRSQLSKTQIEQWHYTDLKGIKHISPKYKLMGVLLKQLFPGNFYTQKRINKTQAAQLQNVLLSMSIDSQNAGGVEAYSNTFLECKFWGTWGTDAKFKTCIKESNDLYVTLKNQ